jgi:L-fuconate dehydratase
MITHISTRDLRYPIGAGHGSDAIHRDPVYSYAVIQLHDDSDHTGCGLAFTLGEGNELVCAAAAFIARGLQGRDIESVMAGFGALQRAMADEQQFRWLGPHKGVVHLALAAVTNACWDLWAKRRGLPLWMLLLELSDDELLATLDLSYVDDELPRARAAEILGEARKTRAVRAPILKVGYPGYDTSVGWFNYSDEQVRENCLKSVARGFTAMKLKVGSSDPDRDIRRANILRETAGDNATIMLDANQQWSLNQALAICPRFLAMRPYWIEEPTHPDDVAAHRRLARAIAPTPLALGEHVPNRVVFKNYLLAQCCGFVQVDALRVAGVSEFIVISLLARKFGIPVVPHVGDMGQLHQHLVLFNHIALDLPALFLEHIPHLRDHFRLPVRISDGLYRIPQEPGAHCDLR